MIVARSMMKYICIHFCIRSMMQCVFFEIDEHNAILIIVPCSTCILNWT
jgi:hypothetical protein